MDKAIVLGRPFFAIGVAFLGLQQLIYRDFIQGPFIAPSWVPGRVFWACVSGLALVAAALGVAAMKKTRLSAAVLAALLFLVLLLFHFTTPLLVLRDGIVRTRALETLAMAAVALVLFGAPAVAAGRLLFALTMVVFGIQHFQYAAFVATVVPSWIPGALGWVYFTGVAMIAAGVSLAVGIQARLSATWLGVMFLSWVVILHLPRVASDVHNPNEWNSAAVALAVGGASWVLAATAGPVTAASLRRQRGPDR